MALQAMGSCGPSRVARTRLLKQLNDPTNYEPENEWVARQHRLTNRKDFSLINVDESPKYPDEELDPECEYTVDEKNLGPLNMEIKWFPRPCDTRDQRPTAPLVIGKLLNGRPEPRLHPRDRFWIRPSEPPLRCFMRAINDIYPSHWSSRCEDPSTLMDNVPSTGGYRKQEPKKWGMGPSLPPINTKEFPKRFPGVSSTMVRFVDDIHTNDRLFKMYS